MYTLNFTPEIAGISTYRKVSDVVWRLGVFLRIISGLGSRQTSWLMQVLFQVMISKSAIDRWSDRDGFRSEKVRQVGHTRDSSVNHKW
jgi:hypothetical protein